MQIVFIRGTYEMTLELHLIYSIYQAGDIINLLWSNRVFRSPHVASTVSSLPYLTSVVFVSQHPTGMTRDL